MRALKVTLLILAGLVVAAVLFVVVSDHMQRPPAPDWAAVIAKSHHYDVRIKRDSFGVPHIVGRRDADVAFGLGFAQAEDDFATLQQVGLATRGRLAASEGRNAAVADYLVHLLRVWETVNAKYETDLPADVRQVLDAYSDGVNYYGALHQDKVIPGVLPLTGKDIAAGFVFKTPFFYGLDGVLLQLSSPQSNKTETSLSLSKDGQDAFLLTHEATPVGSNAVAVGPPRSSDGATRLLVNSHQPYIGPVSWYEAVLESGQGWHVAGGFFPGSPFMLHGHNEHLGWANTVNHPDLIDVYKLTINPANPNQYQLDGHWRDFEKSDAKIRVKIWGPLVWTVHRDVFYSAHGPVLKTDHGVFALRYAGINDVREPLQYYRLNKAANLAEWRAAMALQAIPSLNFVYADEKGTIGYIYNGLFPARQEGPDWQDVLPGDRSDLIWHQYLPFEKVPQIWNPRGELVFNSNNTPYHATAGDELLPKNFSSTLGIQANMTNRAWRALETYGADFRITPEKFHAYKFDLDYSVHSDLVQLVDRVIAMDLAHEKDAKDGVNLREAQEILKRWDHRTNVANRSAALAVLMGEPLLRGRTEIKGQPQPPTQSQILAKLREAVSTLKTHFGRLDPEWGAVNRLRRGKVNLAVDGGPDIYRAVYGLPQPDGTLTAAGGDTFIMFVSWDKKGKLTSESIHQFGSATLDQNSPHYADQTPLFVAMKTKPVLFTQAQLSGHIEVDYRPGEPGAVVATKR